MPELFGHTRAAVRARHALITPQNHVNSAVPGITGATAVVLINPAMGANFAQTLLTFQSGGSAEGSAGDLQTFGYVVGGGASVNVGGVKGRLGAGGYFFCPAGSDWTLAARKAATQVNLFPKEYAPPPGGAGRDRIGPVARQGDAVPRGSGGQPAGPPAG